MKKLLDVLPGCFQAPIFKDDKSLLLCPKKLYNVIDRKCSPSIEKGIVVYMSEEEFEEYPNKE